MLTTDDHRRDSAGLRYVYPVVSRRAGGVSVGINLNVNQACNWACLYCQVPGLTRGGPPPVDLDRLASELSGFLDACLKGDFLGRNAPPESRRLVDVAFSGDGEPTSAEAFDAAVGRVIAVMQEAGLAGKIPIRLITNGTLLHRTRVQQGISRLGATGGEVWFKLDRGRSASASLVSATAVDISKALKNLATCCALAPTWVQTCWFALDGETPDAEERSAYCAALAPLAGQVSGIHLYGLARPSMQPGASRLTRLPAEVLAEFAAEIQRKTGIRVQVSP